MLRTLYMQREMGSSQWCEAVQVGEARGVAASEGAVPMQKSPIELAEAPRDMALGEREVSETGGGIYRQRVDVDLPVYNGSLKSRWTRWCQGARQREPSCHQQPPRQIPL